MSVNGNRTKAWDGPDAGGPAAVIPVSGRKRIALRCPRGFTVIELMIAAVIAIVIFGIGLMMITGASSAHNEAKARIRTNDKARVFFEQFERDLSGAYSAYTSGYDRDSLVETQSLVAGTCPTMTTTSEDFKADAGTEYQSIRYYVVQATKRLCREKAANGPFSGSITGAPDVMLCADVERLETSFYKVSGTTYAPAASASDATHVLVKLTLLDPNEKLSSGERQRIYQVYMPIPDGLEP